MATQEYGPRRSRATRKPSVQCPDVVFYRCETCGMVHQRIGRGQTKPEISCCGLIMEELTPISAEEAGEKISIIYKIVGGYMKYLIPGKRPPMVFALADEDAFSYCDESPCLECVFWCKRGFVIYGYVKEKGLIGEL